MAVVSDFVLEKAFEAVYDGVKDLIVKNFIFKSLFKDVKSRLDDWAPLIKKMAQYNQKMDRPEKELEALKEVMEKGQELVNKCSTITRWSPFKKYWYATQLLEWKESLKSPLETLKVQEAVNIMEIRAVIDDMQRVMLKQQSAESSSSTRLKLPPLPRFIVGLDGPLNDLKKKLLADDGVSRLVLTAPGGCGKTTLATMFCQDEEVKGKFKDNITFITVSQKGNLELVVKQLCESESSPVPTFQNNTHMLQWMHTFFEGGQNPMLLVLDDIWSGSESILDSFQFEMSNYKILVTSRSEFPKFGSSYPLKLLDDDKAMELFYDSTSLGDKCSPDQEELSIKIVKRCNGFPLAITVVGRSLSGQPIEVWRKRVSEWSKDSSILDTETELFLCLQSSLDALDKRLAIVKDCYLDLGSFPEDKFIQVDDLIDMWAELYDIDDDSVCFANVYELAYRNLANLVDHRRRDMKMEGDDFYGARYVIQHDLLRELAIYNAKLDPVEQRKRMIIEIKGNKIPKWWREQRCHPIKARLLSITTTDTDFDAEWPDLQLPEAEVFVLHFRSPCRCSLPAFVQKMDKLKALVIDGYVELINFELLGFLPNLKRISLIRLSLLIITNKPIQLKSVKKISFKTCDMEGIGEGVIKMSDAFPNLEELNINRCDKVEHFLVELCNLIHLKKISIFNCGELLGLPKEIGNLVNLEVLRIRACEYLPTLPSSVKNLKKLKFLDISRCRSIWLPENIGELSSLRKLDMRSCFNVKELPQSVLDLHQLEEVTCNDEDQASLWEPFLPNLRVVVIPWTQPS